jgi:hypothetical protein
MTPGSGSLAGMAMKKFGSSKLAGPTGDVEVLFQDSEAPPSKAARLGLWLGGIGLALVLLSGPLTGLGLFNFQIGLLGMVAGAGICFLAMVLCAFGQFVSRRRGHKDLARKALLMILPCVGVLGFLYFQTYKAFTVPPIHEVSTSLISPPPFQTLKLRDDYLKNVPTRRWDGLVPMTMEQRWRTWHEAFYGDIKTIETPWTIPETTQRAEAIARKLGWEIVRSEPAKGQIEATATSRWFRFKDDIAIRVMQGPFMTIVDIRSISRVGQSDLGANAARVRAFLAAMKAEMPAAQAASVATAQSGAAK